jgi:hypothetical protein
MLKNGKFKFGKTYPNHCNYIHPGIIVKWTLNCNLDFIIYSHKREGIWLVLCTWMYVK